MGLTPNIDSEGSIYDIVLGRLHDDDVENDFPLQQDEIQQIEVHPRS